jgi:dolichyl-phosphate-mannose-protein mannosyltransferase
VVSLPASGWTRATVVAALAAGLVPLGVYVATLSPTVNGGDSGELIAVAYVGGVAHPPGYPLHAMLGKLLTLLPLGSVAWRVNLLSALGDAGAAVLLFRALVLLTGDVAAGLLAAGAFAFAPLVWPYAITAEVFALNNLFAAGLLYWSARALREDAQGAASLRTLHLAAFWMSLGLANHHTLLFFSVPVGLVVLALTGRRLLVPRVVAGLGLATVLGFLPYLYLPLAAARAAPVTWGDTASWAGFLDHFLRREYGTFRLADESVGSAGSLLSRLALFGQDAARSTFFSAIPLGLAALAPLGRPGLVRRFTGLWIAALLFYLIVFCSLANVRLDDPLHVFMQERFWQQGLAVVAALLGLGLAEAGRVLGSRAGAWLRWPVAAALPLALVVVHGAEMRAHANTLVRDYGEAVLRSVPAGGVLLVSSDDTIGSVRYLQEIEGVRRDVRVLPIGIVTLPWFRAVAARHMPDLVLPPGAFTFRQFLDANLDRQPVVVCNRAPWLRTLEEAYALWPLGLVEQVLPRARQPGFAAWTRANEASFARFDPARAEPFPPSSWEHALGAAYWKQYERYGLAVVRMAARRHDDPAAQETTVRVLERLAGRPTVAPVVLRNLGVAYQFLSQTRPDALALMVRHWRRYLALEPRDDADLPKIRLLVEDAERSLAGRAPVRP